jgi:thiol-disulfide isomerase/thioredoxin
MYFSTLLALPLFFQAPTSDAAATSPAAGAAEVQTQALAVGSAAPAFNVGKWLKGTAVDKLDPKATYIIECWATWCGPCVDSLPHLNELAKDYKDKVHVLAINVWDKPKAAEKFLAKNGKDFVFPVAYDGADENAPFAKNWLVPAGIDGIPTAFIVHQGKIAAIMHPGMISKEMLDALVANDTAKFKEVYDAAMAAEEKEGDDEEEQVEEAMDTTGMEESVFNVSHQVAKLGLENVLSGLAFTLQASDKNYQPAPGSFSFHEPTGLLYFRGTEAQLALVKKALHELAKSDKAEGQENDNEIGEEGECEDGGDGECEEGECEDDDGNEEEEEEGNESELAVVLMTNPVKTAV